MTNRDCSRRQFALLAGSGTLVGRLRAQPATITARQIVDRIQKNVGVPWRAETVDLFKTGDPDTPVKGIATTFMSTLAMLQRSAAAGKNFIITHEPTFYNHLDNTRELEDDPVYQYKQEFVRKNRLVVWRFHDHWHARKPDGIFVGFARTLGWEVFAAQDQANGSFRSFVMPPRPFAEVARDIQTRLKTRSMRLIGDPKTPVAKVCTMGHDLNRAIRLVRDFDLLIAPEVREWDSVEYLRDLVLAGQNKAAVILAHERVEEFGMEDCATWLRTFVPEVPVEYLPSGEPFWIAPRSRRQAVG